MSKMKSRRLWHVCGFFVMAVILLATGIHGAQASAPTLIIKGHLYRPDGTTYIQRGVRVELLSCSSNALFNDCTEIAQDDVDYSGAYQIELCVPPNNTYCPSTYDPDKYLYLAYAYGTGQLLRGENDAFMRMDRPNRVNLGKITTDRTITVPDQHFTYANVEGSVYTAPNTPAESYQYQVALTKHGESTTWDDHMKVEYPAFFWFDRPAGSYDLRIYSPAPENKLLRTVPVTIGSDGVQLNEVYTTTNYQDLEFFQNNAAPSTSLPIAQLLDGVNRTSATKDTVGLNVHMALQGVNHDSQYVRKLYDSGTKWVREHFATNVRPDTDTNWSLRYTTVRDDYRRLGINVVAMLMNNFTATDTGQPDLDQWREYVTRLVTLHKDYIKVWEVWNEPDLTTYLTPNTADNYIPILKTAYEAIKSVDPDALVLSAPTSWPNASFIEQLYQKASGYFDEPAFHVYYCDQYKRYGDNRQLQKDFNSVLAVMNKYRPGDKAWITELGCSTYNEYSEDFQREYLAATIPYLLSSNRVEKILLYTTRDRSINDPYEDNFGLLHTDFSPKTAWDWYVSLGGGRATPTAPIASGSSFFAYNTGLRGGYHVAAGNVLGGSAAEVIAGSGDGMAPQIRVFDGTGNLKSQFFAFDTSLRNGVTVSACDVNGDGYDEIVTAQGRGGWPLVKIFNGYGTVINNEFSVLDGKYTGGVNLSCGDTDGDGTKEIVVAAMHGGGPQVMVYNQDGRVLTNFMAYDPGFRGGINVTTADADGDGKDEIITGPQYGAPHVQIFQIRAGAIHRLSPGFFAFNTDYRGGVDVAGVDTNGDGTKEIVVSVGDDATPFVKVYNIREEWQTEFFAFATNFLGGVNIGGGDVDGDGADELLVIPRGHGAPQVRIISVNEQ